MRRLLVTLFALGVVATCTAQSPAPRAALAANDLARLLGSWSCDGFAPGSSSVETYTRQSDGSVVLSNRVHTSVGSDGTIVEIFTFDAARATWTLSAPPNPLFGGLRLSGGRWSGDRWELTGIEVVQNAPRPVRIVYTDLGGAAFRREHQAKSSAGWTNDGEFVCKRTGTRTPVVAAAPKPTARPPIPAPTPHATVSLATAAPTPKPTPRVTALPSTPTPTPRPTVPPTPVPTATPTPTPTPRATVPPSTPSATPAVMPPPTAAPPSAAPSSAARSRSAPSPSAAPLGVAAVRPAPRRFAAATARRSDRAYALVGDWNCESAGGEPSTHRYVLGADGSITLLNDVRVAARSYEIVETYRFDSARHLWTTAVRGGGYVGTASPWSREKWIFNGIETERGRHSAVRMIYTDLGTQAYRRDFQLAGSGQTFVSETCKRS